MYEGDTFFKTLYIHILHVYIFIILWHIES